MSQLLSLCAAAPFKNSMSKRTTAKVQGEKRGFELDVSRAGIFWRKAIWESYHFLLNYGSWQAFCSSDCWAFSARELFYPLHNKTWIKLSHEIEKI